MQAKEHDSQVLPLAPQGLILIFPSLKKGEAGGGSQINKTFPTKLNLSGNYNFVIGEPLRHCVPPPLLPSARGGIWKSRDNCPYHAFGKGRE